MWVQIYQMFKKDQIPFAIYWTSWIITPINQKIFELDQISMNISKSVKNWDWTTHKFS
jgi:hypothetical protein